jgi:hypothetical protein|tara:strand:- start:131 stop:301 length:171 start_codon:yes stop_codon:yes gene_type:complete
MYNIILYVGVSLMLIGFFLFMWCEVRGSQIDRELFRNKQLMKSFLRNKEMERRKKW